MPWRPCEQQRRKREAGFRIRGDRYLVNQSFQAPPFHEPSDSVRSRERNPQFLLRRHKKRWQRKQPRLRGSSLTLGSPLLPSLGPSTASEELECPLLALSTAPGHTEARPPPGTLRRPSSSLSSGVLGLGLSLSQDELEAQGLGVRMASPWELNTFLL